MQESSFYATLKLITGEEILAEVSPCEENEADFFLIDNPIVINESTQIDHQKGVAISGLLPKKWMLYSSDGMSLINRNHVISISELDKFGTDFYFKALIAAKLSSPIKRKVDSKDNIGYVGTIDECRSELEEIFKNSPNVPDS
jgi:hypothetical protein